MKAEKSHTLWISILTGGTILVFLISAYAVINLPFSYQWLNCLLCAVVCFTSLRFSSSASDAGQAGKGGAGVLLLAGIAEVILSVVFLRVMVKDIPFTMRMSGFILLSPMAYTGAFRLLFVSHFPQAGNRMRNASPNPLSEFQQPVREMMEQGRRRVSNPVAYTMLAFTLAGAIAYLTSIFTAGHGNPLLFFIPAALGYLLGLILDLLLTYRWQRWARRSGISETELQAAARAAHLWWPRSRGNTTLEKPGKFTG